MSDGPTRLSVEIDDACNIRIFAAPCVTLEELVRSAEVAYRMRQMKIESSANEKASVTP